MVEITRTETTSTTLFTNQKEVDRAIQAAVDKDNEIYSHHIVIKHQRSRHRKSKTQAQRKLRRHS
jgi:hypothetical protein